MKLFSRFAVRSPRVGNLCAFCCLLPGVVLAERPFALKVVDADTKRPVPLIRITTTNQVTEYTDNAGMVTFDDPDLANRETWFSISGHGYEMKADGFGNRGVRFVTHPGQVNTIGIKRVNIAERVQRLTGGGLLYHQQRFEGTTAIPLNGQVFGCDTVDTALHGGKRFWLWGDTSRPSYPLGNFDTTLATTPASFDPGHAFPFTYFTEPDGFVKRAAPIAGNGPTWLGGLVSLKDKGGKDHLVATYSKIKQPMDVYERGLCEFDEKEEIFKKVIAFETGRKVFPDGHAFRSGDWLYFGQATPNVKIPADYESWRDPSRYVPVTCDIAFTDTTTGKPVKAHNGSVTWNPWRKKWISIFTESGGT